MSDQSFELRAVRALRIDDSRVLPGTCFRVPAAAAVDMIRSGVAALVNERDLPALVAAVNVTANTGRQAQWPRALHKRLH